MSKIELSPRAVRLSAALILTATFIVGAAAGAGLTFWLTPNWFSGLPPSPPPLPMLGRIPIQALGLDPKQMAAFNEIVERHRPELDGILKASFPKVLAVTKKMEAELRTVLTPEQQKRLDEINARRSKLPDGSPGPMGPPPGRGPGHHRGRGFGGRGFGPPDGLPPMGGTGDCRDPGRYGEGAPPPTPAPSSRE